MKKSFFTIIACALISCLASCSLDDAESSTKTISTYFTITGINPNYKLISDGGTIVYPTAESVSTITNTQGFGTHKRAQLYAYFKDENVTTVNGATVIREAELQGGSYLDVTSAITAQQAQDKNITAADSIFAITSMDNCWLANGYFNTIFSANYSIELGNSIAPSAHLSAYSPADNILILSLLYNQHSKKDASTGSGSFAVSFDISKINVPGNDSIAVTFQGEGFTTSSNKVPRSALSCPE